MRVVRVQERRSGEKADNVLAKLEIDDCVCVRVLVARLCVCSGLLRRTTVARMY